MRVCNGRTYGGGFYAAPEAQPDDGWLDVFIIRRVGRLTIARLLGMYKGGKHFRDGALTEQAKPYFLYRRAKCVSLRPADGRGPIVATADGECAPCEAITARLRPLAGRVLLPKARLRAVHGPAGQRINMKDCEAPCRGRFFAVIKY